MGIFLAVTKLDVSELKRRLVHLDERVLTLDKVRELMKLCPTPEEVTYLSNKLNDAGKAFC